MTLRWPTPHEMPPSRWSAPCSTGSALDDALDALPAIDARDRAAAHRLAAAVLRRHRHARRGAGAVPREGAAGAGAPRAAPRRRRAAAAGHAGARRGRDRRRPGPRARPRPVRRAGQRRAAPRRRRRPGGAGGDRRAAARHPRLALGVLGRGCPRHRQAHQHAAPLDISLYAGAKPPADGTVLPTGSVRYPAGTRVAELPGFADGEFWVQDAAAALPARLLAPHRANMSPTSAPPPAARRRSSPPPARASPRSNAIPPASRGCATTCTACGLDAEIVVGRRRRVAPGRSRSMRCCSTRRAAPPAPSAATRTCRISSARATSPGSPTRRTGCSPPPRAMLRPGGRLVYAVCSLQPEEGPPRIGRAARRRPAPRSVHAPTKWPCCRRPAPPEASCARIPACGPSAAAWTASSLPGLVRA